jgi:hypothetical protein
MLKNILKLEGTQVLSKEAQKEVAGGAGAKCLPFVPCSFFNNNTVWSFVTCSCVKRK